MLCSKHPKKMRAPQGAAQTDSRVSASAAAKKIRAPIGAAQPDSRVSASAAAQHPRAPQGGKSAVAPLSGSGRALKPCAERRSAFHISYFISHISLSFAPARQRPLSGSGRALTSCGVSRSTAAPRRSALSRRLRRRHLPSTQRVRHFRDASASTLAERPTGATLFTQKGPHHG